MLHGFGSQKRHLQNAGERAGATVPRISALLRTFFKGLQRSALTAHLRLSVETLALTGAFAGFAVRSPHFLLTFAIHDMEWDARSFCRTGCASSMWPEPGSPLGCRTPRRARYGVEAVDDGHLVDCSGSTLSSSHRMGGTGRTCACPEAKSAPCLDPEDDGHAGSGAPSLSSESPSTACALVKRKIGTVSEGVKGQRCVCSFSSDDQLARVSHIRGPDCTFSAQSR